MTFAQLTAGQLDAARATFAASLTSTVTRNRYTATPDGRGGRTLAAATVTLPARIMHKPPAGQLEAPDPMRHGTRPTVTVAVEHDADVIIGDTLTLPDGTIAAVIDSDQYGDRPFARYITTRPESTP